MMRHFIAVYITTDGKEWTRPLCVENNLLECKRSFTKWYETVNYKDISVRYAPVKIIECSEVE